MLRGRLTDIFVIESLGASPAARRRAALPEADAFEEVQHSAVPPEEEEEAAQLLAEMEEEGQTSPKGRSSTALPSAVVVFAHFVDGIEDPATPSDPALELLVENHIEDGLQRRLVIPSELVWVVDELVGTE